jgi:hypothetical protein
MMNSFALVLFSVFALAQPPAAVLTAATSASFTYPGSTTDVSITFADSTPSSSATGFQFSLTPPAGFTAGTPTLEIAAQNAGAKLVCSTTAGVTICLITGSVVVSSGLLAVVPITAGSAVLPSPTPVVVTVSGPIATTAAGTNVPITYQAGAGVFSLPLTVVASGGATKWFSISSGGTTCQVHKIAQTPIRISWTCNNPYGGISGGYTADATNGGNGINSFSIGMNILTGQSSNSDNVTCNITMNGTGLPVTYSTFPMSVTLTQPVTIQPQSANYICITNSVIGPNMISWP